MLLSNIVPAKQESKMSDFEDEEGVDEPVLDDENDEEGTEEEEVRYSLNILFRICSESDLRLVGVSTNSTTHDAHVVCEEHFSNVILFWCAFYLHFLWF